MDLWRLEVLRLVRTRRWLSVAAVLVGFGFISPVVVRYIGSILERFGSGELQIIVREPRVTDGMREYAGNAQQLGILVVVLVAAAALAIDSRSEMAVFLRSRVRAMARLLLPRLAVNAAFAALAFLGGALAAWYETEVLLGSLPVGRTLAAIAAGMIFQGFVVAVVALAAALARSYVQTAVAAVGLLLGLPILSLIDALDPWLPSRLIEALGQLDHPWGLMDYLRPLFVAVLSSAFAFWFSARRLERREV